MKMDLSSIRLFWTCRTILGKIIFFPLLVIGLPFEFVTECLYSILHLIQIINEKTKK